MKKVVLYRGDSLPKSVTHMQNYRGRTFANYFCTNGLMARFADGGSSRLLYGLDALDIVLKHVGYDKNYSEEELAYHSPMISFSEMPGAAFQFAERTERKRKKLETCDLHDATHFMWRLELELGEPEEPGLYPFRYKADPENCNQIISEQLHQGQLLQVQTGDMNKIGQSLLALAVMSHALSDESEHHADLINVVEFVSERNTKGREKRLVENTLNRASRDMEWLLYPKDSMPGGQGYSSRFVMNKHLSVYGCFKEGEKLLSSP